MKVLSLGTFQIASLPRLLTLGKSVRIRTSSTAIDPFTNVAYLGTSMKPDSIYQLEIEDGSVTVNA